MTTIDALPMRLTSFETVFESRHVDILIHCVKAGFGGKPMRKVFKYPLHNSWNELDLPKGAKFLSAADQDGVSCLWFEVDPSAELERRCFCIVGTGQEMKDYETLRHLSTFMQPPFVWHVYESVC